MSRKWFGEDVATRVKGLARVPVLVLPPLIRNHSGYVCGSPTGRLVAMYVPFLTMVVAVGMPPLFAAVTPAFFSGLCILVIGGKTGEISRR